MVALTANGPDGAMALMVSAVACLFMKLTEAGADIPPTAVAGKEITTGFREVWAEADLAAAKQNRVAAETIASVVNFTAALVTGLLWSSMVGSSVPARENCSRHSGGAWVPSAVTRHLQGGNGARGGG